jgi:hypothetical protein
MPSRLGIAVTVFSAVACGLLACLWARSYGASDVVSHLAATGRLTALGSLNGHAYFGRRQLRSRYYKRYGGFGWHYERKFPDSVEWSRSIRRADVLVPYSYSIPVMMIAACLPWIKLSFSLRTLLLATALVAVILSLVMLPN